MRVDQQWQVDDATEAKVSSLAWYVVHTKPRQEETALLNLERQGFDCYLPRLRVEKIRRQKLSSHLEPLFPRYLFICLDSSQGGQNWAPIRSTIGVNRMLQFGETPAKVDDRLIEALRDQELDRPTEALFSPGARVQVVEGPFKGLDAVYQMAEGEQRSMILIDLLQRPLSIAISTSSLRKI